VVWKLPPVPPMLVYSSDFIAGTRICKFAQNGTNLVHHEALNLRECTPYVLKDD